jgi:ferredoxin
MLTPLERLLFLLFTLLTVYLTLRAARRLVRIIARGQGKPDWAVALRRLWGALVKTVTFSPVFRTRLLTSLLHGFVAWGFIYYLLVNLGDVLEGFIPEFVFMGEGGLGRGYRVGADLLSVAVLAGMVGLLVRRFLLGSTALQIRQGTLVHPKARGGIRRDSAIVGGFILVHVGSRFLGDSFQLAASGGEAGIPFASLAAGLWSGWTPSALTAAIHVSWWLALGTILAFFPYFPRSKHIHLIFTPINFLLQPERASMGALDRLDFEDPTVEQFGAQRLEQLSWKALLDAYSCIMCNRCQDACPAYASMRREVHWRAGRPAARVCWSSPSPTRRSGPAPPAAPVWTSARWAMNPCGISWTSAGIWCSRRTPFRSSCRPPSAAWSAPPIPGTSPQKNG